MIGRFKRYYKCEVLFGTTIFFGASVTSQDEEVWTMVGLLASELQAETLFPGDTIEYFSMVRSCAATPTL